MKIKDNFKTDSISLPRLFVGYNISIIILPYNHNKPEIFMKKEDGKYYSMVGGSGYRSGKQTKSNFTDLFTNIEYELFISEDHGFIKYKSLSFEFLKEIKITNELDNEYVPHPNPVIIEHAFKNSEFEFYITRHEYYWDYDSFNFFVLNKNNEIKEYKVSNVERYRDGGTTYYYTDFGTLYKPTAFSKELIPTITYNTGTIVPLYNISDPYNYLGKAMCEKINVDTSGFISTKKIV